MRRRIMIQNLSFCLLVLVVTLSVYQSGNLYDRPSVLISNFLILVVSLLLMVFGDQYNFSMNKVFYLFSFFFFGVAPAIQYQQGVVLWSQYFYTYENYFFMNILILLILSTYQGFYMLFSNMKSTKIEQILLNINQDIDRELSNRRLLIISFFSLVLSLIVYRFQLSALFVRGGSTIFSEEGALSLIYFNFIRPIPAISLFFFKQRNNNNYFIETALWIMLLLTSFPLAAARFYIAAIYIPILLIYSNRIQNRYLSLNKLLIIGLLLIFPFLDQVRRLDNITDIQFTGLDFTMFVQGHFDSFQMFMYVVVNQIITHGQQLFTALLFFVPRAFWPGKSIGSGSFIANRDHFLFDNISMNYFGEGYINFGYAGIFLFIIVLAFLNARYDKIFWINIEPGTILNVFYLQGLGLQFFILRGDLLSGFAFMTGMLISTIAVHQIATYHKGKSHKIKNYIN